MNINFSDNLSRRERQIVEIVYRRGSASVADVQEDISEELNYSTVRALLRILEEKGFLKHRVQGQKYVYHPVIAKKKAVQLAIKELLNTFFNNSVEDAVLALLEFDKNKLSAEDLRRLSALVEASRKEETDHE